MIRTDNIGDLICTTPLLKTLRDHYPSAYIAVLINTYSAPVLDHNPDINAVFTYEKSQHFNKYKFIANAWKRFKMLRALRNEHFDYIILAREGLHKRKTSTRFARFIKPKHIIGYLDAAELSENFIDMPIPNDKTLQLHETEHMNKLLEPLGIYEKPGDLRLFPDQSIMKKMRLEYSKQLPNYIGVAPIAVCISVRRPRNHWSKECFIELIKALWNEYHTPIMLIWSPGKSSSRTHPGDDEQAQYIMAHMKTHDVPLFACATQHLSELIAALACLPRAMICSDGGAMHVAAAFKVPTVCFFGAPVMTRWHPWGTHHVLLHPNSHYVSDITVNEALIAYKQLTTM